MKESEDRIKMMTVIQIAEEAVQKFQKFAEEQIEQQKEVQDRCLNSTTCRGCPFYDPEAFSEKTCRLNGQPHVWRLDNVSASNIV